MKTCGCIFCVIWSPVLALLDEKPLSKRPEVLTCSPPPSLFPFQCLILQIDIIRCIIRPLIHHGNGLGRSAAQMCFSPPPPLLSLAVSKASEPLISFSSSFFCSSKGLAAVERLRGGRGGAEGGGGGCNWRLEPWYPSRCPHRPISILSAVQSRRSIRKTRPLTSILILYGLCECEKAFHVAWVSVKGLSLGPCFVTDIEASVRHSYSGLACAVTKPLGLLARHWC